MGGGRQRSPSRFCPAAHICTACMKSGHYIVRCPLVLANPEKYSQIDVRHGCFECGSSRHKSGDCLKTREPCKYCGDTHSTDYCPFNRKAMTWHEFYDEQYDTVYFESAADGDVTWDMPLPGDTILWCCDACNHLLPDNAKACPLCAALRRRTGTRTS
jgi:hypothetical protein